MSELIEQMSTMDIEWHNLTDYIFAYFFRKTHQTNYYCIELNIIETNISPYPYLLDGLAPILLLSIIIDIYELW